MATVPITELRQSDGSATPYTESVAGSKRVYLRSHWQGLDGKPPTYTPTAHPHGNISNDGKIGTTANLVVITTTSGLLTTANRSGIDSRATYPPASHIHGNISNAGAIAASAAIASGDKLVFVDVTDGNKIKAMDVAIGAADGTYLGKDGVFSKPSWTDILSKPTTLAGYGITDTLTASEIQDITDERAALNSWSYNC